MTVVIAMVIIIGILGNGRFGAGIGAVQELAGNRDSERRGESG
jgi:hypothetical protein